METLPGETPLDDVSGLRVRGITTRQQLNELEAENIRKVLVKYLGKKPSKRTARFDYSWSLKLHREMFGDVWKWAGTLQTCDLNVGVPWGQVEARLYSLLNDLPYWEKNAVDLIEQSAMLHHRAVAIHPFQNGNGRWARMLANIWLKLHDRNPTLWPEQVIGSVSTLRREYLATIKQADSGDYTSLVQLHQRFG